MKQLEGNPGKRPLNEREPTPPKGTIRCPNWLEAEAKKEWERILDTLLKEYGLPEEDNGVRWARREIAQLEP